MTGCLTVLETIWVITSIVLAVFIRQIAVVIAVFICFAAVYNIKKRFIDKEDKIEGAADNPVYNTMDEENQQPPAGVAAEVVAVQVVVKE